MKQLKQQQIGMELPSAITDPSLSVDNIRGWKREQLRPWLKLMKIKESGTNAELAEKLIDKMFPGVENQRKGDEGGQYQSKSEEEERPRRKPLASILKKPKDMLFEIQTSSKEDMLDFMEGSKENDSNLSYALNRRQMIASSVTGGPKWRPKKKGFFEEDENNEEMSDGVLMESLRESGTKRVAGGNKSPTAERFERHEYLSNASVKSAPFINSIASFNDSAYKSASVGSALTVEQRKPDMTHAECQTVPHGQSVATGRTPDTCSDYYTRIVSDLESVTRLLDNLPLPSSKRNPSSNPAKLSLYCVCHGGLCRFHVNEWGMLVLRSGEIWLRYEGYKLTKFVLSTVPPPNRFHDEMLQKFDFSDTNYVCPDCVLRNNSENSNGRGFIASAVGNSKSAGESINPAASRSVGKKWLTATADDKPKQTPAPDVVAATPTNKNLLWFSAGGSTQQSGSIKQQLTKETAQKSTGNALLSFVAPPPQSNSASKIPSVAPTNESMAGGNKENFPLLTRRSLFNDTPVKHVSTVPATSSISASPRRFNDSPRRVPGATGFKSSTISATPAVPSPLKRPAVPLNANTTRAKPLFSSGTVSTSAAFRPSRTLARTP